MLRCVRNYYPVYYKLQTTDNIIPRSLSFPHDELVVFHSQFPYMHYLTLFILLYAICHNPEQPGSPNVYIYAGKKSSFCITFTYMLSTIGLFIVYSLLSCVSCLMSIVSTLERFCYYGLLLCGIVIVFC